MPPEPFIIVAIDGGAASGKSSTSRALSDRFNFLHVDTGSFYRAVTAELLRQGLDVADLSLVRPAVAALRFDTALDGRSARMVINGKAVDADEIRGPEVNAHVSHFAAVPEVRTALLAYQRGQVKVAQKAGFRGLVMEGRDIGTVIFPDADFRFFLHADPEERARRRAQQGQKDSIAERDRLDTQRKTAPLSVPVGATAIDSTSMTLDEVVNHLSGLIAPRIQSA